MAIIRETRMSSASTSNTSLEVSPTIVRVSRGHSLVDVFAVPFVRFLGEESRHVQLRSDETRARNQEEIPWQSLPQRIPTRHRYEKTRPDPRKTIREVLRSRILNLQRDCRGYRQSIAFATSR